MFSTINTFYTTKTIGTLITKMNKPCINIQIYKINYLSLCLMKCLETNSTKYISAAKTNIALNVKLPE